MNCDQARELLHAYIDDELDLATALELEKHLPGCPACQKLLDAAQIVSRAVSEQAAYYRAPDALRDRLIQAMRSKIGQTELPRTASLTLPWWRRSSTSALLAAAAVIALAGSLMLFLPPDGGQGQFTEVVGSHVRSLEANHLMDVESTDQHTVKPWFAGKIDFSPPVVDLKGDGFPLSGGRLDYLHQQKVAALIYRHDKHIINLFIWPGQTTTTTDSKDGFNIIRFQYKGMICWAISDLNATELQHFVDLLKSH